MRTYETASDLKDPLLEGFMKSGTVKLGGDHKHLPSELKVSFVPGDDGDVRSRAPFFHSLR